MRTHPCRILCHSRLWKVRCIENTIKNPMKWHAFITICLNSKSPDNIVQKFRVLPMASKAIATISFMRFGQAVKLFFWKFKPFHRISFDYTPSVAIVYNHQLPRISKRSEFFSNNLLKSMSSCNRLPSKFLKVSKILPFTML